MHPLWLPTPWSITLHMILLSIPIVILESLLPDGIKAVQLVKNIHTTQIYLVAEAKNIIGQLDTLIWILSHFKHVFTCELEWTLDLVVLPYLVGLRSRGQTAKEVLGRVGGGEEVAADLLSKERDLGIIEYRSLD